MYLVDHFYARSPRFSRKLPRIRRTGQLAEVLDVTKSDLAAATGLSRDSLGGPSRLASHRTQQRLNELVRIIEAVLPWAGQTGIAYAWYLAPELLSFGRQTPAKLLKSGRSEHVDHHLSRISENRYNLISRPNHCTVHGDSDRQRYPRSSSVPGSQRCTRARGTPTMFVSPQANSRINPPSCLSDQRRRPLVE